MEGDVGPDGAQRFDQQKVVTDQCGGLWQVPEAGDGQPQLVLWLHLGNTGRPDWAVPGDRLTRKRRKHNLGSQPSPLKGLVYPSLDSGVHHRGGLIV